MREVVAYAVGVIIILVLATFTVSFNDAKRLGPCVRKEESNQPSGMVPRVDYSCSTGLRWTKAR